VHLFPLGLKHLCHCRTSILKTIYFVLIVCRFEWGLICRHLLSRSKIRCSVYSWNVGIFVRSHELVLTALSAVHVPASFNFRWHQGAISGDAINTCRPIVLQLPPPHPAHRVIAQILPKYRASQGSQKAKVKGPSSSLTVRCRHQCHSGHP
jgi:hypothetical protein